MDSRLSRIVLHEQRRRTAKPQGGDASHTPRDPLNFYSYVGNYEGDAVSRRSWAIGGGWLRFSAKNKCLWDQTSRIRREVGSTDPHVQAYIHTQKGQESAMGLRYGIGGREGSDGHVTWN